MAVKDVGSVRIDGVSFQLAETEAGGLAFEHKTQSAEPTSATEEEATLGHWPTNWARTIGFLDWTGGAGLSVYQRGDKRFHWSEGPSGVLSRTLHRGHQLRRVALGVGGEVSDFFEINDALYVVNGDYVRKITPTLNAETVAAAKGASGAGSGDADGVRLTGAGFTEASPLWYDGTSNKVFLGSTGATILSFNGTAWAQDDDMFFTHWTIGRYQTGERLWGTSQSSGVTLQNLPAAQNPFTAAQWSVRFTATNTESPATACVALRDSIVFVTEDGLIRRFITDDTGGYAYPFFDESSSIKSADNGRNLRVWNGRLIVPLTRGLFMFEEADSGTGGVLTAIGPETLQGHESPLTGPCTALCASDPEWLYAAFYNGTDSYIYQGRIKHRDETVTSETMVWQPVGIVEDEKVTALHLTHLGTNPILCAGSNAPALYFVTLPRTGKAATTDANCRSETAERAVYLSDHDALAPALRKRFYRVTITSRGMSDTEIVNVYARVDGGDYTKVGEVTESPSTEIRLDSSFIGFALGLKFGFEGSDATVFPTIHGVEIDFSSTGEPAQWIDVQVLVGQNQLTFSGRDRRGTKNRLVFLSRLAGEESEFDVVGPDNITYSCKVDRATGVTRRLSRVVSRPDGAAYLVALRLNVYDDLIARSAAVYEVSPYTEGTNVSYYDTTSS